MTVPKVSVAQAVTVSLKELENGTKASPLCDIPLIDMIPRHRLLRYPDRSLRALFTGHNRCKRPPGELRAATQTSPLKCILPRRSP